jgi:hypothetical protein
MDEEIVESYVPWLDIVTGIFILSLVLLKFKS